MRFLLQPLVRPTVASEAAAITMPVGQLSDAERATLAKELGYTKIGKELPDDVTLTDIVKSMPPEVGACSARDGMACFASA